MRYLSLIVLSAALPLSAQWIKFPTAGIPRTADGKPDLNAPTPRTPDGKPDLSGIWHQPNGVKYTVNLASDLPADAVQMQPWAAAVYKERQDNISKDDPVGHCNFPGIPQMEAVPYPYKIVNGPGMIVVLYEAFHIWRQIYTDGRAIPADANPTWMGYSAGHWDGDTLVVETAGMNDKTWIDTGGRPHSEALHVTERLTRRNFGNIDLKITIDDPKTYLKPWTVSYPLTLMADTELLEYVCNENNVDVKHLVGK